MPSSKSPPSHKQPEAALAAVTSMRKLAEKLERKAVIEAIKQGWTWLQIAEALDITKQAAHKRHASAIKNMNKSPEPKQ